MIKNKGIYEILNTVNGKRYIGSSKELNIREQWHFSALRGNRHPNKYLQNAVNKYGIENFEFNHLEYCDEEYLITLEQWYLDNEEWHYNLSNKAVVWNTTKEHLRIFEPSDIIEIFEMYSIGFTQKEISDFYGCSSKTLSNIFDRKVYKEVEVPAKVLEIVFTLRNKGLHLRELTCEDVKFIKELYSTKEYTQKDLGQMCGLSGGFIGEILRGDKYTNCT